jgi:allantoicase
MENDMDFTELVDLTSERLGGAVLYANDDFFAPKENLLKPAAPIFLENEYTDRGKWMDGWESRRKRVPGYDWCVVRLGLPGIIRGVIVDTSHFKGNFPEQCSLEACALDGNTGIEELIGNDIQWAEILPQSMLQGDSVNSFSINNDERFTHLRFKIYPDGGVARLRVYGDVVPDWLRLERQCRSEIDLAAVEHGGLVLDCSDMFFGHRHNMIMPGNGVNMSDGWETKRRRGPGHDWSIVRLGRKGVIHRLEVDTSHFKGNFPESCSLEARDATGTSDEVALNTQGSWKEVLARTTLQAHTCHHFESEIKPVGAITHVRFNIFPDGGVSRLRVYGTVESKTD